MLVSIGPSATQSSLPRRRRLENCPAKTFTPGHCIIEKSIYRELILNKKYEAGLKKAREENISHYYQRLLKDMLEDKALDDQAFILSVFLESMPTILTTDQKKSLKALAKEMITDKAELKNINEKIKLAPNV